MRSITHYAAANILNQVKGEAWVKRFLEKVTVRVDDLTEIWSCYLGKYATKVTKDNGQVVYRPIPNALKKGTAARLKKFDEYQLAKYKADKKAISLIDIVNLSLGIKGFAKPVEGKTETPLAKLITGTLRAPETWEVKQTRAGQQAKSDEEKAELKAKNWRDLIVEKKLGYFALIKNLRNIDQQADQETLELALKALTNEKFVKKSRVLPFRFFTAYEELAKSNSGSGNNRKTILKEVGPKTTLNLAPLPSSVAKLLRRVDWNVGMAYSAEVASATKAGMEHWNNGFWASGS